MFIFTIIFYNILIYGQKAKCRNPQKHNFTRDTLNILFTYKIIFDLTSYLFIFIVIPENQFS